MRYSTILLPFIVGLTVAKPRHHHHHRRHVVRRAEPSESEVVVVCVLDGEVISEEKCQEGIQNGWLAVIDGEESTQGPAPSPAEIIPSFVQKSVPESPREAEPVPEVEFEREEKPKKESQIVPAPVDTDSDNKRQGSGESETFDVTSSFEGTGLDSEFPDGEVDCSTFPSEYGAVALDHLRTGGWASIQNPKQSTNMGYDDIETIVPDQCPDGNCCKDGMYCAYACPPGYRNTQWPETQGATGQSIGGLQCENGKLHLTNPGLSTKLCMPGYDGVTVKVENKLNEQVPICETVYPGSEAMVIPTLVKPSSEMPLFCPKAEKNFKWKGMKTSAQYYINYAGLKVNEACTWNEPDSGMGNYSPLNVGVSEDNGIVYASCFPNHPSSTAILDYVIEIVGDDMNGKCKYINGQYCSGDDYSNCSTTKGCTVAAKSGTLTFVFSYN